MNKIMIAVLVALGSASLARAGEIRVDFDGAGSGQSVEKAKIAEAGADIPAVTRGIIDPFDGEDPTELNHFKKGRRCVGGNCEDGYPGESCNIHTCGKKSADSPAPAARAAAKKETQPLDGLLRALTDEQQQRFYGSLHIREGAVVDFYSKDIKAAYGEAGVSAIIRHFLPGPEAQGANKSGCRPNDPDCTEDSYIDDARCNITHTCVSGFPGSTCTEAC